MEVQKLTAASNTDLGLPLSFQLNETFPDKAFEVGFNLNDANHLYNPNNALYDTYPLLNLYTVFNSFPDCTRFTPEGPLVPINKMDKSLRVPFRIHSGIVLHKRIDLTCAQQKISESASEQKSLRIKGLSSRQWRDRYRLFSLYDLGIQIDASSWHEVTPEDISIHIANRISELIQERRQCVSQSVITTGSSETTADVKQCAVSVDTEAVISVKSDLFLASQSNPIVIVDGCCGDGGNTVALTQVCDLLVAVDILQRKVDNVKHNCKVYEVPESNVKLLCEDFCVWAESIEKSTILSWFPHGADSIEKNLNGTHVVDCVFLSPPWGGPSYQRAPVFSLTSLDRFQFNRMFAAAASIAPLVVLYLPRCQDICELVPLAASFNFVFVEVQSISLKVSQLEFKQACVAYFQKYVPLSTLNEVRQQSELASKEKFRNAMELDQRSGKNNASMKGHAGNNEMTSTSKRAYKYGSNDSFLDQTKHSANSHLHEFTYFVQPICLDKSSSSLLEEQRVCSLLSAAEVDVEQLFLSGVSRAICRCLQENVLSHSSNLYFILSQLSLRTVLIIVQESFSLYVNTGQVRVDDAAQTRTVGGFFFNLLKANHNAVYKALDKRRKREAYTRQIKKLPAKA